MSKASGAATFRTPAEAYDRHVGRYGRKLVRALIAAAEVRRGQRALDVGCGPGALTSELAALLGADHVAAVEPSAPFAEACRRRNPGAQVELGSAEELPFAGATFDHALAQLAVNFMTDPPAGVREMVRVTRPGGAVTAAVWDYAGEMTILRCFWDAALALDPSAATRDEARMPFCAPGELGELWFEAGLGGVQVLPVVVAARYGPRGRGAPRAAAGVRAACSTGVRAPLGRSADR